MCSQFNEQRWVNVLLVGQVYIDTILHVTDFPEEDTKTRAIGAEQRTGGNTYNTAQVLAQFDHVNVCYMSAAGSRETSSHITEELKSRDIQDVLLFRREDLTPSSTIIHNQKSGSRTIISNNNIQDMTCIEFIEKFNDLNQDNSWWVHFEGRNIDQTLLQIDWLDKKAISEDWRHQLTISVELEKPERLDIELLIEKADIVLFSKLFAQHHGFTETESFLRNYSGLRNLKPGAKVFCTWGSKGASVLDTNQIYHATTHEIKEVKDTVGAGDTFNAGIIASLTKSHCSLASALQFACTLATNKVAQQGFENLVMMQ
ncbi:Ribokinase-like protein [Thamnidium elegans]|nr:Ribokinase-like protein [Thamnidium elegans]